jgi:glutaconate CoA-transferase subunit B
MTLASLHPGVSVEQVRDNLGWPVRVAAQTTTEPPTADELRLLREELDPRHLYI